MGEPILKDKDKKKKKITQKMCDNLLTPIIIRMFPRCMLCSNPTQVAHHHCHKSKSLALRYNFANLINLCHRCHLRLHHNESVEAGRIIALKGLKWNEYIQKEKQKTIKPDYEEIYLTLKHKLDNL